MLRRSLYYYLSIHTCMNGAMIVVGTCNRECPGVTTSCSNVATIKTIIIGRNGMCHVIGILPGDSRIHRHRDRSGRERHACHVNCIGCSGGVAIAATF